MAVRLLYISVDGSMRVEKTNRILRMVEMPDGNHPVTNDSVYQDAKRLMDPLMILVQGVRAPIGGTMEIEDISSVLYEIDLDERAFKKPRVSRMWMRAFEALVEFIRTKGLYFAIVALMIYFIAQAMLEAA